jgi:hypothetical protein
LILHVLSNICDPAHEMACDVHLVRQAQHEI